MAFCSGVGAGFFVAHGQLQLFVDDDDSIAVFTAV
jgi:hypothetical protein